MSDSGNKWEKFPTGVLKGYNFALLLSSKPNELIVYGGSEDPANDVQLKKYYIFNCANNQVTFTGEVKDPLKFDFDFDNIAACRQTLIRSLKGNRQEFMLLRFLPDNTYELQKKDVL